MKKYLLFFVVLSLFFAQCTKQDGPPNSSNTPQPDTTARMFVVIDSSLTIPQTYQLHIDSAQETIDSVRFALRFWSNKPYTTSIKQFRFRINGLSYISRLRISSVVKTIVAGQDEVMLDVTVDVPPDNKGVTVYVYVSYAPLVIKRPDTNRVSEFSLTGIDYQAGLTTYGSLNTVRATLIPITLFPKK